MLRKRKVFLPLIVAIVVFLIVACATDRGITVEAAAPDVPPRTVLRRADGTVDPGTAEGQGSPGFVGGDFGLLGDLTANAVEVFRADIIIVGAGGAGMTAAIEAYDLGAKNIVILEKTGMTGGNTAAAGTNFAAANSRYQPPGVDFVPIMIEEGLRTGRNFNNPDLLRVLVERSADALHWLNDRVGTRITNTTRGTSHTTPWDPDGPPGTGVQSAIMGTELWRHLDRTVRELGIPLMLNTEATNILVDDNGTIIGVRAMRNRNEVIDILAPAVILTTGGYAANPEMIVAHSPRFVGFFSRSHPGSRGGGIVMAYHIGADVIHMNFMPMNATVEPATRTTLGNTIQNAGGIVINLEGRRFINDLIGGPTLAFTQLEETNGRAFIIFDDNTLGRMTDHNAGIIVGHGLMRSASSLAELARIIGVDAAGLEATVERYNRFAAAGTDEDFGRPTMHALSGPRFHAVATVPAIGGTTGGIRTGTSAEVLRPNGSAITGLWAAGETTGGLTGYNRHSGHSLADIAVFGRIAAASAVNFVSSTHGFTQRTNAVPQVRGNFTNGVHQGNANGHNGPLTVAVTVVGGNIVDIEFTDHRESAAFFESSRNVVVTQVIRNQNIINVDRVAGATLTSFGLIAAINDALR